MFVIFEVQLSVCPCNCLVASGLVGMDLPCTWNSERGHWKESEAPFFIPGEVQLFSVCSEEQQSSDTQSQSIIECRKMNLNGVRV